MKNYRLYLVRHGVTQGNLDGIYMGSGTDQPLCAQGAAQLRALAARFPYPKAETVFSSPMRRAPELWMADSGCGYLLQCSPELWMRDGIVEVSDIIPFGYLDEEEGK